MTSEERFPPRRELPDDLRERLRDDVLTRLGRPRRGRWAPVAAAVLLLVGGVSVGTQLWRVETPVSDPGPAPVVDVATRTLNRCWAAVQLAGKTDRIAARDEWVSSYVQESGSEILAAFTAAGKPVFCATTPSTVTLTDPNAEPSYAKGTRTGLLLHTTSGIVAGVADPTWARIELSYEDGLGILLEAVHPAARQFSGFTGTDPAEARFWAGKWDKDQIERSGAREELPAPPPPLFTVTDRPGEPLASAATALAKCLDGLPQPPADRASYQPGATLENGPYQVVLARNGEHGAACTTEPDPANPGGTIHRFVLDTFIGLSLPVRRLSVPELGGKVPFVGILDPAVTAMTAGFETGGKVNIPLLNGTFAVWLPADAKPTDDKGNTWVRASDAKTRPVFNGYVPMK